MIGLVEVYAFHSPVHVTVSVVPVLVYPCLQMHFCWNWVWSHSQLAVVPQLPLLIRQVSENNVRVLVHG